MTHTSTLDFDVPASHTYNILGIWILQWKACHFLLFKNPVLCLGKYIFVNTQQSVCDGPLLNCHISIFHLFCAEILCTKKIHWNTGTYLSYSFSRGTPHHIQKKRKIILWGEKKKKFSFVLHHPRPDSVKRFLKISV